jgi:hypothetical protein
MKKKKKQKDERRRTKIYDCVRYTDHNNTNTAKTAVKS